MIKTILKRKINNNIIKEEFYKLKCSNTKDIKYIIHLSDIHIKNNNDDRDEYTHVFNNLYDIIKKYKNLDETITVITGDIFHNKTWIRPEAINMIKNFMYNLSQYTDIVYILGNHDININNKESLDIITPIISKLETKNKIYCLNENANYEYNNLLFSVTTLFTKTKTPFINKKNKTKINLYHGYIHGTTLDINDVYLNYRFNLDNFSDGDLLLLGDIHKSQFLGIKKQAGYPGSLKQQNYGESIENHGFIYWDIKKLQGTFVQVPNKFGYCNIKVIDNNIIYPVNKEKKNIQETNKINSLISLPENLHIKLFYKNTNPNERLIIKEQLKNKFNILEYREIEIFEKNDRINLNTNNIDLDIIKRGNNIEKLIYDYLETLPKYKEESSSDTSKTPNKFGVSSEKEEIMKTIKSIIPEVDDVRKNIKNNNISDIEYKDINNIELQSLEFSNLFVYGENNFINFANLKKIVGILAPNKWGKSSLINIILLSIWGYKCMDGIHKNDIININKKNCRIQLVFKFNEILYRITREYEIKKKKNKIVAEKLFLEKYDTKEKNNWVNIKNEDKISTEDLIISMFGYVDDFLDMNIITQNNPTQFVNLTDNKKKEYIDKIFKLDIFKKIATYSRGKKMNLQSEITNNTKENEKYRNILNKINFNQEELNKINNNIQDLNNIINQINCDILILESKLNNNNHNHNNLEINYDDLIYEKNYLLEKTSKINKNIQPHEYQNIINELNSKKRILHNIEDKEIYLEKIKKIENEINHDNFEIEEMNRNNIFLHKLPKNIKNIITKYEKNYQDIMDISSNLNNVNQDLINTKNLFLSLENHKYNPDCEICMSNNLTQQKISLNNIIKNTEKNIKKLNKKKEKLLIINTKNHDNYNKYYQNLEINKIIYEKNNKLNYLKERVILKIQELNIQRDYLTKAIDNENIIKDNNIINTEINKIQELINNHNRLNEINKEIEKYLIHIEEIEYSKKINEDIINKKKELEKLNEKLDLLINEKNILEKNKEEYNKYNTLLLSNQDKIKDASKMSKIYENIRYIIDSGLINNIMKNNILPAIERQVNHILEQVENYKIEIVYDTNKIFLYKKIDNKRTTLVLNSGHERGIDNIVFRLAFSLLNNHFKVNFVIFDECFKFSDAQSKDNLRYLFEYIKNTHNLGLVVSHDDFIKDIYDNALIIEKDDDNYSKITCY
jgi:DNA repair exonuclease SbcCD nuclease subunit